MEAQAGAPEVPVPCCGQAARRGDSIPAYPRARVPEAYSSAQLCLLYLNVSATDVGFVDTVSGFRVEGKLAQRFGRHLLTTVQT